MKLEVKDAGFAYSGGRVVLHDISFAADSGQILAVLGPNGAGKTTLLRCILGFLRFTQGSVLLDGINADSIPSVDFWKKAAYVPQAKDQSFPLTVAETVLLGRSSYLHLFETPGRKDREAATAAMERTGIMHLADRSCAEISGGELQLVLIARALAAGPQLLVLDEPETGLDFRNQLMVLELIRSLSHDSGITVIFNTHYPDHALGAADSALVIDAGGGAVFGRAEDILNAELLRRTFGVEIFLQHTRIGGRDYPSVIPVSISNDV